MAYDDKAHIEVRYSIAHFSLFRHGFTVIVNLLRCEDVALLSFTAVLWVKLWKLFV